MTKAMLMVSIEPEVKDLAIKMYPRQISALVEDYLRQLTQTRYDIDDDMDIDEFEQEYEKLQEDLTRNKLQLKAMEQAKKAREKKEEKELDEYLEKAAQFKKAMPLSEMMRLHDEEKKERNKYR